MVGSGLPIYIRWIFNESLIYQYINTLRGALRTMIDEHQKISSNGGAEHRK